MEPFTFDSGKLKGVEVLHFDDVEIQKVKGNSTSFSSMGTLSVLHFKNFDRFVLKLNGWTYPLFRRIPVTSTSNGDSKIFELPAANGFNYRLIFNNASGNSFTNFESILSNSSHFGDRKLSASPDDKVVRKTSGHKEGPTVAGLVKSGVDKVKEVAKDLTGPSKKKPLAKKRMMPGSIKNTNFKKSAKATFKKDFFDTESKLTQKFLSHRKDNANLSDIKEFKDLKKTTDSVASTLFLKKEEIEDAILRQKDLIKARNFTSDQPEKKGIVDSIKQGITGIKEQVSGMIHREAPREPAHTQTQGQQGLVEGMTHYSG